VILDAVRQILEKRAGSAAYVEHLHARDNGRRILDELLSGGLSAKDPAERIKDPVAVEHAMHAAGMMCRIAHRLRSVSEHAAPHRER
jgi:hypothetical protein